MLPSPQGQQGGGFFIAVAQGLGADHLRDRVAAGQLPADRAEGQVGHPGHRRQDELGVKRYVADLHWCAPLQRNRYDFLF